MIILRYFFHISQFQLTQPCPFGEYGLTNLEMIMKNFIHLLLILLLVSNTQSIAAQDIPPKLQNFIQKLESEKQHLQGGAFALLYKGQVVYKSTFGHQRGNKGAITSKTLFPLASVSKAVTGTAIALMVDQGKLNPDESFKLQPLQYPVTLKNILSHTTGYTFKGNYQIEQGMPRSKLMNEIKREKPKHKPGKHYSYSNTLFSLVEEALNMKGSSLNAALKNLRVALKTDGIQMVPFNPSMAVAYPHIDDKSLPFPPYYPKAAPAGAGIFASLDAMIEILKLSSGYRSDLISQKSQNLLYTPLISNNDLYKWNIRLKFETEDIDSLYGLGWRIFRPKNHPNKDLIFHSGYIGGISTLMGYIPSEEIGIIILINQKTSIVDKSVLFFWNEFLE